MLNNPEIIESRKKAATLLKQCLYGRLIVREALKQWPESKDDPTLLCAKHALIHYEADEDLQKKDPEYISEQISWLEQIINTLSNGEALPKNIIETYEEYYVMPVSIKTKLVYLISYIVYSLKSLINNILKALGKLK